MVLAVRKIPSLFTQIFIIGDSLSVAQSLHAGLELSDHLGSLSLLPHTITEGRLGAWPSWYHEELNSRQPREEALLIPLISLFVSSLSKFIRNRFRRKIL